MRSFLGYAYLDLATRQHAFFRVDGTWIARALCVLSNGSSTFTDRSLSASPSLPSGLQSGSLTDNGPSLQETP